MRLSEAFMLGITTCKLVPKDINSCAFGCALNAMGVPQVLDGRLTVFTAERYRKLAELWPWLSTGGWVGMGIMRESVPSNVGEKIYKLFDDDVCTGKMTLEQLHDYIKSVEPDCDCNQFNCSCQRAEPAAELAEPAAEVTQPSSQFVS